MLEDVGVQIPGVGRVVRQQSGAELHQLDLQTVLLFGHLLRRFRFTSCSAPLIAPTLMCFASLPFWSQPTSARSASITAAAAR
ncbi:hypothetical protein MJK72_28085 [Klebsiella pneumoniae]|nr:hypothetical protein MJK72_28085 [Klebsiella pneumoniae]